MTLKRRKSRSDTQSELSQAQVKRLEALVQSLRRDYARVTLEPVPERLQKLVEELRAREAKENESD
ncbi:MAG: RNA polymerase subunit sigma-70 [Pseudomonadota bacterium]